MFRSRNIALWLLLAVLASAQGALAQATYYSRATGNWSTPATWSTVSHTGAAATTTPGTSDNVEVRSDHTVTLDVPSAQIVNFTILGGAGSGGLLVNGNTLTITGNAVLNNPTSNTQNADLNVGSGTLNVTGTLTMNGASNNNSRDSRLVIGTGTATISGGMVFDATNLARKIVLFQGAGTLSTTSFPNSVFTLTTTTGSTVEITGGTAFTLKTGTYYNLILNKTAGDVTMAGTNVIGGDLTITSGTLAKSTATITVNGTTSVTGTLLINNATGTQTFTDLIINSGGTMSFTAAEVTTMNGNLQVDGTGTITGTQGVWTFQKTGGGGTLSGTASSTTLTGATFTTAYTNSSTYVVSGTLTVTGTTLTNNGTLTATTALSGTGGVTQGLGANLHIGGTSAITTLTATVDSNAVYYDGAAAQTIKGTTYHHLILSNAGAKTAGAALTVNGNLTIEGTATFSGGTSLTHDFGGNWIVNTTAATPFTFTTASTINFNTPASPAATSLDGSTSATITFNDININNTSGFVLNKSVIFSTGTTPTLTVGAGATLTPAAGVTLTSTGTLTGGGTVKVTRTAATADFNTQYAITTKTLTALTVDYDATAAQSVNALNYFNLTISGNRGGSTVTFPAASVGVSGAFAPNATSAVYGMTGNTINFNGTGSQTIPAFNYENLTSSSTGARILDPSGTTGVAAVFTPGTNSYTITGSTIDFDGTGAQSVPAFSYNNLTISGARTTNNVTLASGTVNIAGNFNNSATFSSGGFITTGNTVNFNGTGGQTISGTAASCTFNNFTVNKSAGTLAVASSVTSLAIGGTVTVSAGTFDAGTATAIDVSGNWTNNGGAFIPGSSTVAFVSTTAAQSINGTAATQSFGGLTVAKGAQTLTLAGGATTLNLSGTVTLTSGTFNAGANSPTISLLGNWVNNGGTFTPVASTVVFNNQTASQLIQGSAVTQTFNAVTVDKGSYTLGTSGSTTALVLNGTLTMTTGTFNSPNTVTIAGDVTLNGGSWNAGSVTSLAGNWTNNGSAGAFNAGTGYVNLTGSSAQAIGGTQSTTFDTLRVSKTAVGNTVTLNRPITLSGNLTIYTGTLDDNGNQITGNILGSVLVASNGVLTLGSISTTTVFPTNYITANVHLDVGSTINYVSGVNQVVSSIPTYGILSLSGGGTKSLNAPLDLLGGLNIGANVTLDDQGHQIYGNAGSPMTMGSNAVLVLGSVSSATSFPTGFTSSDITLTSPSTIIYNSNQPQAISSVPTYRTLSLASTSAVTKTAAAALTTDNLTIGVNNTLDAAGYVITVNADVTNNGVYSGTSSGKVKLTGTVEHQLGGNGTYYKLQLANTTNGATLTGSPTISDSLVLTTGNFTVGANTLTLNGPKLDSLETKLIATSVSSFVFGGVQDTLFLPKSITALNNLNVNMHTTDSKLNHAGPLTINGTLTLTLGMIDLFWYPNPPSKVDTLTIASTGNINILGGRVKGALKMWVPTGSPTISFPVGGADVKTQVDLAFTGVSTAGWVTIRMFAADHPKINTSGINVTKSVNRYWSIQNNGVAFTSYNITLNYAGTSDMDAGANPADFVVRRYVPSSWSPTAIGTRTTTSTQAIGETAAIMGEFQVGEPGDKLWVGSAGGGDNTSWSDANNWTPTGVPTPLDVVKLRTAASISITTAAVANSVTLNNSGLTLSINSGSLTISSDLTDSTGTLNTAVAFPTVSGTVSLPGGTVGYTAAGAQNVSPQSYNNLALSGSGAKTFSGTTTIAGDFTIGGTATATTTGTTIVFNGTSSQAVAATTYENLTIGGSGAKTLASGTATVNSTLTLSAGTLDVGAQTLVLNNGVTQTAGTLSSSATGTVNYARASAGQAVIAGNYGNLTFSNFNKTLPNGGTIGVSGTFTPGTATSHTVTGSTFDFNGTGAQTIPAFTYDNLTTSGNRGGLAVTLASSGTIGISGVLTPSATNLTYTITGSTIDFNGSSPQTVPPFAFNNQTVSNTTGLTLSGVDSVAGTLALGSSIITTGSYKVALGSSGSITRTSGYVDGNLQKYIATGSPNVSFEIGRRATYTPITAVTFASVSAAGNIVASDSSIEHPQISGSTIDPTKSVNRFWTLSAGNPAPTFTSYQATFEFVPGDVDGGANTANFIVSLYAASTWTPPTTGTRTATTTQATGITGLGDFAIGEVASVSAVTWDGGAATNNWGDANNWNPDGVPSASTDVNLSGPNTIVINVPANAKTLTLNNSGLSLTVASGQTLTVAGNLIISAGTLNLLNSGAAFPSVAGSVNIAGGTISYGAAGAQTVSTQSYVNLDLAGSGAKTFSGTTNVSGNFTIGGTATTTTTGSTIVFNGSGAQAVAATTYENLTINGTGTKSLATGTTTVTSALTLTQGTLDVGSQILALNDGTTATSGQLISGTAGTVQYTSPVNGQAVFASNYGNLTFNNNNKVLPNGATVGIAGIFTPGSGSHTVTGNTINFNGTGAQTIPAFSYNNLTVSGARTTNDVTLTGTISVAADFTNSATFTTGSYATSGSTVNYNASSGSQAVAAINYDNLTFTNAGATRVFGSGQTTRIAGTFTPAGSVTVAGSTIDFNGASQSVPALTYNNLTLSSSGTKTLSSSTTTIGGNFTVGGVVVAPNSGTVTFSNTSGGQAVAATTYYNLTFSGNSSKTLASGATTYVSGNFSVTGGSVTTTGSTVEFTASSGSQAIAAINYNNLTFSNAGQRVLSAGTTGIAGALTLNAGTIDVQTNSSLVEYNGSSAQTLASMTYWDLRTNNSNGFNLTGGDITINDILYLQSGVVSTGANKVTVNSTNAVSRTSGHISGNLRYFVDNIGNPSRTFTVGDATNYTPVFIQFPNVTTTGFLTATTSTGDHAQIGTSNIDNTKSVNRTWTLTNSGVVFNATGYSATFTFISGTPVDLDAGATTSNFIVGLYNASWSYPTVGTKTGTTTQITGQNTFGDFQIGEPSAFVPKTWDGGASTSNWGDAANWNPDGVPTSSNNVTLSAASATSITVNVAAVANNLTINNSNITLTIAPSQSLSPVGQLSMSAGTLNTQNAFPSAGSYSFTGGTVGYTASGVQNVSAQSYYSLSLAGSGAKTFTGTTNIAGDFTIGGTATATTTGTTIVFNGSGSQAIAATTYNNLTINGSGTKTLASGTTTVGGALTLTGGTLDVAANTLTLNSTAGATSGVLTSQATGTVNYNQGSAGQSVLAGTYGNLTFSAFGKTLASSGSISIAGTFTPAGTGHTITGSTIDFNGSGAQSIPAFNYHNLTISGSRGAATVTLVNGGTIGIAGSFTVTATNVSYTTTGNTVTFNGSGAQSASGFTYNRLTLNNSSGLAISGSTTVNSLLTLTAGALSTGSNTVIIPSAGAVTRTSGFVNGNLQKNFATGTTVNRFFEVGTGTTFAPVNVTYAQVTSAGNLIVSTTAGEHPQIGTSGLDQTKDVNRYWTLTNSGIVASASGYTAVFSFVAAGEMDAGATAANFVARRYSGGWNTTSVGTRWSDSTQVVTATAYGDYAVGEVTGAPTSTWDGGAGTNNWNDANNWNPNGVPTSGTNVDLSNASTIDINTAAICNSITLNNGGLTLTVKIGQSLTVSGNLTIQSGVLNVEQAFPAVTGTISITGGTVGYVNGNQAVSQLSYYNLSLSGSGTKTFASGTTNVAGNFTVSGVTVDASTNSSTINFNGSGAQSIAATTYYNLSLSNTGNKAFATGTTTIANIFSVSGGATPDATSFTTTIDYVGGTQTVVGMNYGTLRISGTGTKTLGGAATIAADLNVAAATFDLGSNTSNRTSSGGTLAVAAGATLKLGGSSGGLTGSNFPSNFTTVTLSGTAEFAGNGAQTIPAFDYGNLTSSSTGTRTLASSSTIGILNAFTPGSNSYTVTGSTVDFKGSTGQTVPSFSYNNLALSTSGTKTFAAGTSGIAGTFSINGSAAADAISSSSVINYNGAGAQTIAAIAYSGLTLSNGGTKTFPSGTTPIGGDFTVTGATADATSNSTTINFNGSGSQNVAAIIYNNLTFSTSGTKTFLAGSTSILGTFAISGTSTADATTNATTINYAGTSQVVQSINYTNLTLSNSGTKTFASGTTAIAGTFSATGSASADVLSNSTTINYNGSGAQAILTLSYYNLSLSNAGTKTFNTGSTQIAGSFAISGASADATTNSTTIVYNGTAAQSVAGITYYALTFTNAGLKTIGAPTVVNAGITVNTGASVRLTSTLQVTGDITNDGVFTNEGAITVN